MAKRNDSEDPDRNVAVNSATDPQRPGSPSRKPGMSDSYPPGTAETTVPTDTATATHEPPKGPEDRGSDPGRGGVE